MQLTRCGAVSPLYTSGGAGMGRDLGLLSGKEEWLWAGSWGRGLWVVR